MPGQRLGTSVCEAAFVRESPVQLLTRGTSNLLLRAVQVKSTTHSVTHH